MGRSNIKQKLLYQPFDPSLEEITQTGPASPAWTKTTPLLGWLRGNYKVSEHCRAVTRKGAHKLVGSCRRCVKLEFHRCTWVK